MIGFSSKLDLFIPEFNKQLVRLFQVPSTELEAPGIFFFKSIITVSVLPVQWVLSSISIRITWVAC